MFLAPMPRGEYFLGTPLVIAPEGRPSILIVSEDGGQVRVPLPVRRRVTGAYAVREFLYVSLATVEKLFRHDPTTNTLSPTDLPSTPLKGTKDGLWYGDYHAPITLQRVCDRGLALGSPEIQDPRTNGSPLAVYGRHSVRDEHHGSTRTSLDAVVVPGAIRADSLQEISPDSKDWLFAGNENGDIFAIVTIGKRRQLRRLHERYSWWGGAENLPTDKLHGPLQGIGFQHVIAPAKDELWLYEIGKTWKRLIAPEDWERNTGKPAPKNPRYLPASTHTIWIATDPGLFLVDLNVPYGSWKAVPRRV